MILRLLGTVSKARLFTKLLIHPYASISSAKMKNKPEVISSDEDIKNFDKLIENKLHKKEKKNVPDKNEVKNEEELKSHKAKKDPKGEKIPRKRSQSKDQEEPDILEEANDGTNKVKDSKKTLKKMKPEPKKAAPLTKEEKQKKKEERAKKIEEEKKKIDVNSPLSLEPTFLELKYKKPEVILSSITSKEYQAQVTPDVLVKALHALITHTKLRKSLKGNEQIAELIKFLLKENVLSKIENRQLVTLAIVLYVLKENDETLWKLLTDETIKRREKMTARELSNIAKILNTHRIVLKDKFVDEFIFSIINDLLEKLKKDSIRLDSILFRNIAKIYKDKKDLPEEFYKVIEDKARAHLEDFTPGIFADIFGSMARMSEISNLFFKETKKKAVKILKETEFLKPGVKYTASIIPPSFVSLVEGLENKKMLDKEILEEVESRVKKHKEIFNVPLITRLYSIFINNKEIHNAKEAFELLNKTLEDNFGKLNFKGILRLLPDWKTTNCPLNSEVKDKIKKQVESLFEQQERLNEQDLKLLYETLKEEIPKALADKMEEMLKK